MAVNNETGYKSPLKEIGDICREKEILFHSDFAQALISKWQELTEID